MPYRLFGHAHATAFAALSSLRSERGQGTVEYVAIILLVATVFAAVITAAGDFDLGKTITDKIKGAISGLKAGSGTPKPSGS